MKYQVLNNQGKEIKQAELNPQIFEVELDQEIVNRALVAQLANRRKAIAHTKTRKDVRGGGIKPWKQKGTGRARHGSIRSPIWIGGGVVFGPTKDRNFSKKINQKEKRKAVFMCLSDRAANKKLVVVDKIEVKNNKTKEVLMSLRALPLKDKKVLLVMDKQGKNIKQALNNAKNYNVISSNSLNVYDLLAKPYLLITEGALKEIENNYL